MPTSALPQMNMKQSMQINEKIITNMILDNNNKEKIKEKENKRKNNEVDIDNNIKNYERNESTNNKSTMMKR